MCQFGFCANIESALTEKGCGNPTRMGSATTNRPKPSKNGNRATSSKHPANVKQYANMLSAMGTEPRLRIVQLLLSAHPEGLVVGEIHKELGIPSSTLSHHLEKLRREDLVTVARESAFLRYRAHTCAIEELLEFLYAECCTRNKAIRSDCLVPHCK